jgi:hypothetical protein
MRHLVLIGFLFYCPQLVAGETDLTLNGELVSIRILGFSQPDLITSKRPCLHELNNEHIVSFVVLSDSSNLLSFPLATFDALNQNVIKAYNAERLNPIENEAAVNFASKLLETHSKIGIEAVNRIYKLEENQKLRKAPIVKYAMALFKSLDGNTKTNIEFSAIRRDCPFFWSAWRADVYQKLDEVSVLAAASTIKGFYSELKIYINEIQRLNQLENNLPLYAELLWLNDTAQKIGSANEKAKLIVKPIVEDEQLQELLNDFQRQLDENALALKQELAKRASQDKARVEALVLAARNKYRLIGDALKIRYQSNQAKLSTKQRALSVLIAKVNAAHQEALNTSKEVELEKRVVRQEERLLQSLKEQRNKLSADSKDLYDNQIDAAEFKVDAANQKVQIALSRLNQKIEFRNIAIAEQNTFYNSEVRPLIIQLQIIQKEMQQFMTNFRTEHAEAIANAVDLKQTFDQWDQWAENIRRQLVGDRKAFLEKRVRAKDAEKRQQREESLKVLALVDFDISKQLTAIQTQVAKQAILFAEKNK